MPQPFPFWKSQFLLSRRRIKLILFNDIISVLLEVFQTFFLQNYWHSCWRICYSFFLFRKKLKWQLFLSNFMYHPSYSELICVCAIFANEPIMMNYSYSNIKFAFASFLHYKVYLKIQLKVAIWIWVIFEYY